MLQKRSLWLWSGILASFFFFVGCGGSSKPISVAVTASTMTVDGADTVTLTATVTNDKNSAGVTWSVSGAGTLSNTSTTSATFTASAATSSAQTATITATSVASASESATVTITIPAKPSITTTSSGLASTVGSSYSVQLAVSGGISPYTWTLTTGTLPSCLTLTSGGLISGTVSAACAGTYNLTFTVTDSGTPTKLTGTAQLTITIAAAPAIAFTGTMPATATYNVAYTGSAAATGGAGTLTYSVSAGALPTGLSLNTSTGAVTGTPTTGGAFNFTIKAADAFGDSATKSYTVTVSYPAMTITTASLPTGYLGSSYTSTTLTATGGTNVSSNYTWALASGSSLPAGLQLSTAGVVSGKPMGTTTGTANFTAMVTDKVANLSTTKALSIVIDAGVSITTSTTLPAGYVGSSYSQQLAATGGSGTGYSWSASSGSTLPGGLTLTAAGLLSGTPTTAGAPSFSLTVTDSAGNTASATFTLTISVGVSVTAPTLASAYPGALYTSPAFTASGGAGAPYTWSWAAASGSSLPSGLNISGSTGIISGTPSNSGTSSASYSVVVTAKDSAGNTGTAAVTVTVEATVAITSPAALPAGTTNTAYSQQLAASGGSGTGYSWTVTAVGNMASFGLSLSSSGLLSSTSLGASTGTANFTATVTDSQSHTSAAVAFTIAVNNLLKINQTSLPSGNVGASYSQTLTASGGSGTYTNWQVTVGATSLTGLGLSLNTSTGAITGTPTQSGTASFTVQVTDSNSAMATQALSIQIYSGLSLPASNSLPAGYAGVSYTGSVSGSGGSGNLSIAVTTALTPANGTLATSVSGAAVNVTGTPTTAESESFSVKLTDTTTGNFITQTYSISITNPTAPSLPSTNPPAATESQSYTGSIVATGGTGSYYWEVTPSGGTATEVPTSSGNLALGSSGLSSQFSVSNIGGTSTLSISGNPTSTGTVSFSAEIYDNNTGQHSSTVNYTITVNSNGGQISGQINLTNACGTVSPLPTYTVTINTPTPMQTTTDTNGNYSFTGIPAGTYTVTPSISGASGVFYPASYTGVAVTSSTNLTGENFGAAVGYTVNGNATYSGATSAGRIYLVLENNNCAGSGGPGASLAYPFTSGDDFTIRGVPPGSYTLQAFLDPSTLGQGAQNTSDPTGVSTVNITNAGVTSATANLTDNTPTAVPASNPSIGAITPTDQGVAISYSPITNSNGVEEATSYDVQFSTSSSFTSGTTVNFKAVGTGSNVWILNNSISEVTGSPFANGTTYYFEARARNAAGHASGWTVYGGGTPTGVVIGAPSSGNQVTGTVTIPSSITPTGPLYVGFYNQKTNQIFAARIASPTTGSTTNSYTVYVPSDSSADYFNFAILDQNNDGLIDAGDVTNTNEKNMSTIAITTSLSNQNLTAPSANSAVAVTTSYYSSTSSSGSSTGYNVNFDLREGDKMPVAVTLSATTAGSPYVVTPVDIGLCTQCGNVEYDYSASLPGGAPAVGDSFDFTVTYSDGTQDTGTTVNGAVTAFGGTGAVVGATDLATNLSPNGNSSSSLTPTFTWTWPTGASTANYFYSFYLSSQTSCSGNNCNVVWQIPGDNANSNGFTYAQDQGSPYGGTSSTGSLVWNTDPSGSGSSPTGSLSGSTLYNWMITVQDSNGNQAQNSTWYQP